MSDPSGERVSAGGEASVAVSKSFGKVKAAAGGAASAVASTTRDAANSTEKIAAGVKGAASKVTRILSGSFPGLPVDATVAPAMATPPDATCWERSRDAILLFFVRFQPLFVGIAIFLAVCFVIDICVIVVAFWGAVFGVGILGPEPVCDVNNLRTYDGCITTADDFQRCTTTGFNVSYEGNPQFPPKICIDGFSGLDACTGTEEYVAEFCNLSQRLFNICIKVIVFVITYVNCLPIAWRLAIMIDAWAEVVEAVTGIDVDYRESGVGLDFYGRKTEAMWFHIPSAKRAIIASLLVFAIIFQVINLVFCLYFWPYIETQTSPGVLLINVPALFSIICQIAAGCIQSKEETKLITAQPDRFPAPVGKYLKEGFSDWKSGRSGKTLWATLKDSMEKFKEKEGSKGGQAAGFFEIQVVQNAAPENV